MGTAKIDKLSHKKVPKVPGVPRVPGVPKVPGVPRVRVHIRSEQARDFGGRNSLFAAN